MTGAQVSTWRGDLEIGTTSLQRCQWLPKYFGPSFSLIKVLLVVCGPLQSLRPPFRSSGLWGPYPKHNILFRCPILQHCQEHFWTNFCEILLRRFRRSVFRRTLGLSCFVTGLSRRLNKLIRDKQTRRQMSRACVVEVVMPQAHPQVVEGVRTPQFLERRCPWESIFLCYQCDM